MSLKKWHKKSLEYMFLDKIPVRIRLSLGHAIWMVLIFTAIGIGVYRLVGDSILQSIDNALLSSATTIRDNKYSPDEHDNQFWGSILDEFYNGKVLVRPYAQIMDISGNIKAKRRNMTTRLPVSPQALARAKKGLETFWSFPWRSDQTLRMVTLPVMRGTRFTGDLVQVGATLDSSLQVLDTVKVLLWISLSIGLFLSIIFGYLLTRWAFRPVAKITKAAGVLGINDLNMRLKLPPAQDELRDLTQAFNEMLDRLEDAFSRLRRFAGDVSHELRTPLSVLRGEAELALRRERPTEEYKSALKTIGIESAHMSNIVEDLLLLARAQGNSIALKWEDVDMGYFITDIEASIEKKYQQKNISLQVNNNATPLICLSPGYFSLALKNILLNAANHSKTGSQVILNLSSDDRGTTFSVKDFGEGIPEESLPYIFDAFYRADTARNRNSGGIGIGLSLAQALVKLHGGSLFVESEVGQGTTFHLFIPHKIDTSDSNKIDAVIKNPPK